MHVALVSVHPTEADARAALGDPNNYAPGYAHRPGPDSAYLGIWRMPEPYGHLVHVFTDLTFAELEGMNWHREGA